MVCKDTPKKGPNHAEVEMSRAWGRPELRNAHLAMPHVAPKKPAYLPRLWEVSRLMDAIERVPNLLLERNDVGHGNLNELEDAASTDALNSAAYD